MVNVGGPSKGCRTCITRKIRCDRQRPSCGQCQKSRRQCQGYRDETDLLFVDQTQAVGRAFAKGTGSSKPTSRQTSTSTEAASDGQATASQTPAIARSPRLEKGSSLIVFFANNFTYSDSNLGTSMFWVPKTFTDLLKYDATRLSVQAAGAMSLARLVHDPHFFRDGQRLYGNALLSLGQLWQRSGGDQDAVLLAVQFLGIFEVLAAFNSSRGSWITHLKGLGHLLHQGPKDGEKSDLGARMLLQSRNQAVVNALQTKTVVPDIYIGHDQQIPSSMHPHVVHSDVADMLLIRLASLQAQRHTAGPSAQLYADLRGLDRDLYGWTQNASHHWHFSKHDSLSTHEDWWDARYDIYPTAITAHVWNKVRAARILVCDLRLDEKLLSSAASSHGDNARTSEIEAEKQLTVVREAVSDICASIPLHWRPTDSADNPAIYFPPLGTAFFPLWPLQIVGSMHNTVASPELIDWILRTLQRIYNTTGTMNALRVARGIRMRHGLH